MFGAGAAEPIVDADSVTLRGRAFAVAHCQSLHGWQICSMIGPDPVQGIAGVRVTEDRNPFNGTGLSEIIDSRAEFVTTGA